MGIVEKKKVRTRKMTAVSPLYICLGSALLLGRGYVSSGQGVGTLLTFWPRSFLDVRAVLGIVGCLSWPLPTRCQ